MATLDAFLIRGKKKAPSSSSSSSLQDTHIQHAFVNPFTVQTKKPSVTNKAPNTTTIDEKPARRQPKRNTIAHYFTPAAAAAATAARDTTDAVDVEMQDATDDVCVIRNKMPVMNLWDMIQYELDQDPFYNDTMLEPPVSITTTTLAIAAASNNNNCIKRRRSSRPADVAAEQHSKRQRKTDHELSSIMTRFLNMGSVIKHPHPPMPLNNSLDLMMNELSAAQEDTEDISRLVRYKQTPQESHLLLYHMTLEFLDFAIND